MSGSILAQRLLLSNPSDGTNLYSISLVFDDCHCLPDTIFDAGHSPNSMVTKSPRGSTSKSVKRTSEKRRPCPWLIMYLLSQAWYLYLFDQCISCLPDACLPAISRLGGQRRPLEYQVLIENIASRRCSISRIRAAFLIRVDVPFAFGVMTARWSGPSL